MFIKILVVDDSASDRLIIKNMLNEYSIITASDGTEALKYIVEQDDIDLMILDLNMPNIDGFEVLEEIRSKYKYKKIKTIILTSYDEVDNEIKGLKLGAVDYIRKPIHINSLKARIEIHVELLKNQKSLEKKLLEQGLAFDLIFKESPLGIAISYSNEVNAIWKDGYCSFSPMFETITGRTIKELIRIGWEEISHPDDFKEELTSINKLKSGEINSYTLEKRIIKPDGSLVWIYLIMSNIYLYPGSPYNQICLIQDITSRKIFENALIESERSKTVLLSHLPGLAYRCSYDEDWTMQYVSDGCFGLTGYGVDSLLGNRDLSFNDIISPEYRDLLSNEWIKILKNHESFYYEYEIITYNGDRKWVLEIGEGIFDQADNVEALEGIIIDISDRKKIEDELKYNSEHDRWTGLYNRNYLEFQLENDINNKISGNKAIVELNLSGINSLSKMYGFHYTQKLIKEIVEALCTHSTLKRILYNTYENRFIFYIKEYYDENELIIFAEGVLKTLESYLSFERIAAGIGIVEIKEDDCDVDLLFKKVLIASEKAIETKDRDFSICFYDVKLENEVMRELDIKQELNKVAQLHLDGSLYLQYQPILDVKSSEVIGFEALARLKSDKLGFVPPLEFIPISEETKLIVPIGEKIICQSLEFLNKLNNIGFKNMNIAINLSVIQLLDKDFPKKLFQIIENAGANPENITLEITESIFSSEYEYLNMILTDLKSIGLKISIDDFGTGYSSLSRERDLNVDNLKLDKSFIDKLMYLAPEEAITGDIISMAHKLGHCVVAEGVEHEKQKQYLEIFGCDMIQGYLLSRPLDEDLAIEFLKNYDNNKNIGG